MINNASTREKLIHGLQLKKARELLKLTMEEVAHEIGVNSEVIRDWEEEKSRPNLKQLEELAEFYGRDIDYFLRQSPLPPENIEFRGRPGQSLTSLPREAKIILARFDELCRTAFEFEKLLNEKREVRVPRFDESFPPKDAARNVREIFNIGVKPLKNPRDPLEDLGLRIFELPIPGDAFSGFSFWHSEYGPCILLNAREIKGRRNFTLAHELAHLVYKHGSSLCYIPFEHSISLVGVESKANQFAVELLLPRIGLEDDIKKRELPSSPRKEELAAISYKWGVSLQALGYRLENLGLIRSGLTNELIEFKPVHFRRPKTPSYERQFGKQFVKNAIKSYNKNFISISKLAHTLQIPLRKALEVVEPRES